MQIPLNGAQVYPLMILMQEHADGEDMVITAQDRGSVYVAFTLASFTIDENGEVEEA